MKIFLFASLFALTSTVVAAPSTRKRIVWEYASIDLSIVRSVGATNQMNIYGAELHLPGRKPLFLRSTPLIFDTTAYKNYLLNKMGAQGWELVSVVGRGIDGKYIFKRQK